MTDTFLLNAHELTKDYGKFRALDHLSLQLRPGEVYGLLGPNGSGKSTAIRILLGFLRASSGEAQIAGLDCWSQSVEVRRLVTYLPGELRLYETMTGRQLIEFLGRFRPGVRPTEIDSIARQFDVPLDIPLTQMSSGMKRKVALIHVLSLRVPLLILDEPTNTLDPVMRDELLAQIRQAKERGQTILFSSHVLAEVETICDRVGILRHGKLVHTQHVSQLMDIKQVEMNCKQTPTTGPDGHPFQGIAISPTQFRFEYQGSMDWLLAWLQKQSIQDIKIEPIGLNAIYQKYHGATP